ncbi:MAG: Gldg family protein, partial [Candidatus Adiutrix sp.]
AIIAYLVLPQFLGFTVLPLALGLIFALLAGRHGWAIQLAKVNTKSWHIKFKLMALIVLTIAILLFLGNLRLPLVYDMSPERGLGLHPQTVALVKKLKTPVSITVNVGGQSSDLPKLRELLTAYQVFSGHMIDFVFLNPQLTAPRDGGGTPHLAIPSTALMRSDNFQETISPINETTINGALARLMVDGPRFVYFVSTFGEKMVLDEGPYGLSRWSSDLAARRITALDYYWPDGELLPQDSDALVFAGPKAPLGGFREELIINYIKNGGKVMLMVDPFTEAISHDFWHPFGVKFSDGLIIDPEKNLAGTDEAFIVSQNYPAHPLTVSLEGRPTVWPLAGAFETLAGGHADLPATVYGLVFSSLSSWLETDVGSFMENRPRYEAGKDTPGPLALAFAAEMSDSAGGGRLLAVADSDFGANIFHGFSGNREFSLAALNWLLDGTETQALSVDEGQKFILGPAGGRLIFWLPVFVWPLLIL